MGIDGVLGMSGEYGADSDWRSTSWVLRSQQPSISMEADGS